MKDPIFMEKTKNMSDQDALITTICNSIQALGRGFDVTSDIRLLYCKGTPGARLVKVDDGETRDLVFSHGVVVPNVPVDIDCSQGERGMENTPVLSFNEVFFFFFF